MVMFSIFLGSTYLMNSVQKVLIQRFIVSFGIADSSKRAYGWLRSHSTFPVLFDHKKSFTTNTIIIRQKKMKAVLCHSPSALLGNFTIAVVPSWHLLVYARNLSLPSIRRPSHYGRHFYLCKSSNTTTEISKSHGFYLDKSM